jgi:hypothetical protein
MQGRSQVTTTETLSIEHDDRYLPATQLCNLYNQQTHELDNTMYLDQLQWDDPPTGLAVYKQNANYTPSNGLRSHRGAQRLVGKFSILADVSRFIFAICDAQSELLMRKKAFGRSHKQPL